MTTTIAARSMALVTLDPGIRGCGLAYYEAARLAHATYVRNPRKTGSDTSEVAAMVGALAERLAAWGLPQRAPRVLAVERPQIYAQGKGKGDPNQLIPLAEIGAGLACTLVWDRLVTYRPRQWKGTIDGDTMVARIAATGPRSLLTPEEHACVDLPCASLAHNVWDAVGIGLHHLGRLTTRVYPGAS